ncbi:MAG: DUF1761 domain-containing protein [Parachlamydiaceae bacterium]|nr:DUF1761 domain-containing protein [Parachlamydiaceae bacterium]
MEPFFSQLNYWALLASGIILWFLGYLWFSVIMANSWILEIMNHGIEIKKPTNSEFASKLIITFLLNLLTSFGVAFIVFATETSTLPAAIVLGLILGICFSAATMGINFLWENRSVKLSLIDIGYPILSIVIASIIFTLWQ